MARRISSFSVYAKDKWEVLENNEQPAKPRRFMTMQEVIDKFGLKL